MTTYTLSRTSPKNTTLIDPGGTVAYEISSTYHLGGSQTTIKKADQTLATIHWKVFQRNTITWNGKTTTISEIFPRSRTLSTSRVYTTPSGEQFKWKDRAKLYCVSVDTGLNLAMYERTLFYLFRSKKSTLDISSSGAHLTDALVVTWAIAEKKARDRRRSRRHGGGGGGGGGDGG
ncbi:unnamed protein product [Rhizoctonia solani]|uniref:DUF6593 domain-containing protein n=1 Tax=Rhizoctonia solani TaxID=456999 RepID=A0A8H2XCI8_9AGAM|nr:hypothetical protein RHS04_01023 [Rhizoctonia solani]CAE6420259.1 unnamed protein product [Rhizoctonia solani]